METYLWLKLAHILSSTLLFGTGLGTAFYMWRADRSGDLAVIASVARNVVVADFLFTTPAVIVQPLTGLGMLHVAGIPWTSSWVLASLALYALIGGCWLPVVWLQLQVARRSREALAASGQFDYPHRRYMRWWYGLGWPAFSGVIVVFYLMVVKPTLW